MFLSRLAPEVLPAEVAGIVHASRANNVAESVTGVMLFDGERFCHYLEGLESHVRRTVAKITTDARNTGFQQLHESLAGNTRRFEGWHVGILAPDGPSPLLAFESRRGNLAVDFLNTLYRDRKQFGVHIL